MQTSESGIIASEQEKKIRRYEQRMRDLIEAYKTQTREKEALETTLKSLLASKDEQHQQHGGGGTAEDQQQQEQQHTELARANGQVLALSSAISTLTEEKRKLERNYLEDKRVTRAEHETILATLRNELDRQTALVSALEDRCERQALAQTQAENQLACVLEEAERVRQRRAETELLELQALRAAHEARVALLEEAVATLSVGCDPDGQTESPQQQHQHCSRPTRQFYPDCQCRCSADDHSRRPPIGQHQQRHTPDILQFDRTLDQVETVHRRRSSVGISSLESTDKMSENLTPTLLISQSKTDKPNRDLDLASLLLTAGEESQSQPIKQNEHDRDYDLDSDAKLDEPEVKSIRTNQQECRHDEIERLQHEVELGRARLDELHEQMAAAETAASRSLQKMRDNLVRTEWAHKQELTRLQQSCNETVLDLQAELARHRNRTIALLAEKEAEITSLKRLAVVPAGAVSQETVQSEDELEFSDVFSGRSNTGACPLYQCCEVKARMSQELRSLRRTRRELRGQLHQLEASVEFLRSDWRVEEARLLARAERAEAINKMASGINMEYLRNVLLRYMGTVDPSCRLLMARAIGKVLQFSSEELSSLATSSQTP